MSPVLPKSVLLYEDGDVGVNETATTGHVHKKNKKHHTSVEYPTLCRQRLQQLLLAEIRAFDRYSMLRETETVVTNLVGERCTLNLRRMSLEQRSRQDEVEEEMRLRIHAEQKAALLRRWSGEDTVPSASVCGLPLYVGSSMAAKNAAALREKQVTHVVNASPIVPCYYMGKGGWCLEYLKIPVFDDGSINIRCYFDQVFEFIDQGCREGGVLVHCSAGQSRSVAFVVGYLVSRHGLSVDDALRAVQRVRPCALPNDGFMEQLKEYENEINQ